MWVLVCGRLFALPLEVQDRQGPITLGPYIEYFKDDSQNLTFDQVREQRFTLSDEDNLNFGFTEARIWLRFSVENHSDQPLERILDVRRFLLDNVSLHIPQSGGHYRVIRKGRQFVSSGQHRLGRFYHFSLTLPPHSQTEYYLEIESADGIGLPIVLSTLEQQHAFHVEDSVLITLYVGLILSAFLFALFMLMSLRERVLMYYMAFLLGHHVISMMLMEGIPTAVFGVSTLWITRDALATLLLMATMMAVLFQRNLLELNQIRPSLFQFSNYLLALMGFSTLLTLFLPHYYSIILTSQVCMIAGACMLVVCFMQFRRQREARHFLMAWSVGILGATIYGGQIYQLLPVSVFTSYAWHIGATFEAILFSYTIAQRVNTERKQRLMTQVELAGQERELRMAQEQLLHAETAAKQELEVRVRERTRDITRILSEMEHENKVLSELSINDGLTRVRNRRFFNDVFPQMWSEALEQGACLSVIMVDIDHFKDINDSYGHLVGDHCLTTLAGVLRKTASRPDDVVCRYGGEEFVILLPQTDAESARWLAERIRRKVADTVCELDGKALTMTASFGVGGMIPQPGLDPMKLIGVCDEALYQSKQNGRDRVTVAKEPHVPDNIARLHGYRA